MRIKNILVEHFSRLKCANVFILFQTAFENVAIVKVCLRETEILIHVSEEQTFTISMNSIDLHLQIDTISTLIIKGNSISFRINTSTSEHFRKEILPLLETASSKQTKLSLNIESGDKLEIVCGNCTTPLTGSLSFRRILELPSENMDLTEWFCHKPHGKHAPPEPSHTKCRPPTEPCEPAASTEDKYNATKFSPDNDDLFYGYFFVLIDLKHLISVNRAFGSKMIHCKRCFKHIGESVREKSAKIWNGNVEMTKGGSEPTQLFAGEHNLLAESISIVDQILNDFQMLGRQSQKILFETRALDSSEKFVFIHVMSRNVVLFQGYVNNESDEIDLSPIDGIKCLFKCETNPNHPLVHFWENDANVVSIQISIEMMDCVLRQLNLCTKFIPEAFRVNSGFSVSYLSSSIDV